MHINTVKMEENKPVGRPTGPKKRSLNITLEVERADNLKVLSATKRLPMSELVSKALQSTYNI